MVGLAGLDNLLCQLDMRLLEAFTVMRGFIQIKIKIDKYNVR